MLRFTLLFIIFSLIGIIGLNFYFTYNIKKELNLLKESIRQGKVSIKKSILELEQTDESIKQSGKLMGHPETKPIASFNLQPTNDITLEYSDFSKFLNNCEAKNKNIVKLIENNKLFPSPESQIKSSQFSPKMNSSGLALEQDMVQLLLDVVSINDTLVQRSNKFRELAYNNCMKR